MIERALHEIDSGLKTRSVDIDILRETYYREAGSEMTFSPDREETVRSIKTKEIIAALRKGNTVIDDDMNYFRSMRKEVADTCCKMKIHYAIIYVNTPLAICLLWNRKRAPSIPDDLVKRIADRFDAPGKRSYSWDEPLCVVNMEPASREQDFARFRNALQHALALVEAKKAIATNMVDPDIAFKTPAFWNIALTERIVNEGYLDKILKESSGDVPRETKAASNAIDAFDVAARRAIAIRHKESNPLPEKLLALIKQFKKDAVLALRSNPALLDDYIKKFKAMLGIVDE